jgi:hypothetical protein
VAKEAGLPGRAVGDQGRDAGRARFQPRGTSRPDFEAQEQAPPLRSPHRTTPYQGRGTVPNGGFPTVKVEGFGLFDDLN